MRMLKVAVWPNDAPLLNTKLLAKLRIGNSTSKTGPQSGSSRRPGVAGGGLSSTPSSIITLAETTKQSSASWKSAADNVKQAVPTCELPLRNRSAST